MGDLIDFGESVKTPTMRASQQPSVSQNQSMLAELNGDKPARPLQRQDTDTSEVEEFVDAQP